MATTNLVEAVLGREQVKWDAVWKLLEWLLDPGEGHGLGAHVLSSLNTLAFGSPYPDCTTKREFQLGTQRDGKGKYPDLAVAVPSFDAPTSLLVMDDVDLRSPGGRRKLENLAEYRRMARELYPQAVVRAVVLTNARDGTSLGKLYQHLGAEAIDYAAVDGWKLLPLETVGGWVHEALDGKEGLPPKMMYFLDDFVAWTKSLDARPSLKAQLQG